MNHAASLPLPVIRTAPAERSGTDGAPAVAEPSDEALLQRVAGGDAEAFTSLYRRYERPVFGVLLRLAGQRALAEEWLQETFTRVWRAAATHDPARGAVRSWLFAIALNTGRRQQSRLSARAAHVPIDEAALARQGAAGGGGIDERLDERRRREAVSEALAAMPAFLREVIVLRCSRELSFAEISAVTGAPQGTLKSRFHRAVAALREQLDEDASPRGRRERRGSGGPA